MIFIRIVVTIIGIFTAILFSFWTTYLGFMWLSSSGFANAQLPGCFRPWTFSLDIGLNMLPPDSLMSCLHSLLGYFMGSFRLIVLAAFDAVDYPLAICMLVHFLKLMIVVL